MGFKQASSEGHGQIQETKSAMVKQVMEGDELPRGFAEVLLVLVPKTEHPKYFPTPSYQPMQCLLQGHY